MNDTDREHLATNIIAHASDGVSPEIQQRVVGYWTNVDPQLGAEIAAGLGRGDGAAGANGGRSAASGVAQTESAS
jgi:catalase